MNLKKINTSALVTSAISLILVTASAPSYAENSKKEQCAGVVKAGLNDCASSEHACAGMNTDDGYKSDWMWVPIGTCKKIAGAHVIGIANPEK
ncbi:MAG: DUF2282 domain-containing protein [Cocleimonas sp.]